MSDKPTSKPVTIKAIRGMEDLLPAQAQRFQFIERQARALFSLFGYQEIVTPIIEPTELFARSVGDASDVVVSKQMYTFTDAGERSNTLRPEGTAGVVRALVEHGVFKEMPLQKLFYIGPMFRYEKPQKGRQRQFSQIGAEFFGVAHPAADVEVIALCDALLRRLGFQNIVTKINNIGCRNCRKAYNDQIRSSILESGGDWCPQCKERARINPMRVFDCKVSSCQSLIAGLPGMADFVCEPCRTHFSAVVDLLKEAQIPCELDASLVRGFDYYSRTVFEVMQGNIGAQSAILGGGRYDYLVEELGGPATPAVGMGIGFERLVLAMEANNITIPPPEAPDLYVLALDEESLSAAFNITHRSRVAGKSAAFDCQPRSAKAGLKAANRLGAKAAIIIGSNELERGIAQRKNLETGEQIEVALADVARV